MKHTNKLLILILPFLLAACAQEKMTNVSPDFVVFAKRFQEEAAKQGVHLSIDNVKIAFDDEGYPLSGNTLGVCRYGGPLIVPEIYISRSWWNNFSLADKELLMFHEMGHCILNRGHENTNYSIMHPYHIGGSRYSSNYTAYMKEIFHRVIDYSLFSWNDSFPVGSYSGYTSTAPTSYASSVKITGDNLVEYKTSSTSTDENGNPILGCGSSDEDHDHEAH